MSFWTSFSSNLRPIRRFTAKIVFFALVTACRLAGAPTRISPSIVAYQDDGVVRPPSEFSMTFGWPPSMMATQLFVVPRSIPMIFPMPAPCSIPVMYRPRVRSPIVFSNDAESAQFKRKSENGV